MNRKIVEGLYYASTDYCVVKATQEATGVQEAWLWESTFATLFVKECMAVADKAMQDGLIPSEEIAKHFGVK
jgi:hypothetical protein